MRKSNDKPEQIQQQKVKGAEELRLRCEGTSEEMKASEDAEKAGQRWMKGRSRERQKKERTKGSYARHESLFVNWSNAGSLPEKKKKKRYRGSQNVFYQAVTYTYRHVNENAKSLSPKPAGPPFP